MPASRTSSHPVLTVLLCLGVVSTFLTALGLGWAQVYLQFFGETADRGDYAIAMGVFATGAALLVLAAPITYLFRLSWTPTVVALVGAVVLAGLAIAAAGQQDAAQPSGFGDDSWTAGIGMLAMVPWCWARPGLLIGALLTALCTTDEEPQRP